MTYSNELLMKVMRQNFFKNCDRIAIVDEKRQYTYRQLDWYSDVVASLLSNYGEEPLAILLPDSSDIIITIVAAMKVQRTFIPIDCRWPAERIQYILEYSGATTLITDGFYSEIAFQHEVICLNSVQWQECSCKYHVCHENNDMYVIYTSGTTGNPKGVAVRYSNVYNYYQWLCKYFTDTDRTMLLSSLAYDLSYTNLFATLLCGTSMYICSKDVYFNMEELAKFIYCHKVNSIKLTPSLFHKMVLGMRYFQASTLDQIILGGEQINPVDVKLYLEVHPATKIINHYGPTEATIGVITHLIDKSSIENFIKEPSIGRPIEGVKVRIVNQDGQPVPIGVTGELILGGKSVARGYYRDAALTEKNFFKDEGLWWYRTGDLVRVNSDRNICILGRKDTQIKKYGYRIELMEIVAALERIEGVLQAHVELIDEKNTLVAFIVRNPQHSEAIEYGKRLAQYLPYFMIPQHFQEIDYIPLMSNGKIDRKELQSMVKLIGRTYLEKDLPTSEEEFRMYESWKEVLQTDQIGIDSNFFQMGGNSFKAVQLSVLLKNPAISSSEIFRYPTIRQLCKYASSVKSESISRWENVRFEPKTEYTDLPFQKHLIVHPFNDILYRNCLYNAVFTVMNYFRVDQNYVLVNEIPTYIWKDEFLYVDYLQRSDIIQTLRQRKMQIETYLNTNDFVHCITEAINENKLVIVHVDCFYEPIRKEMYQITHWPHFLLVTGYNKETQTATVVEHSDVYLLDYKIKDILFSDLENSYQGYLKHFYDESTPTIMVVSRESKDVDKLENAFEEYKRYYRIMSPEILNGHMNLKKYAKRFKDLLEPKTLSKVKLLIGDMVVASNGEIYKLRTLCDSQDVLFETSYNLNQKLNILYGMLLKGEVNETYLMKKKDEMSKIFETIVEIEENVNLLLQM